MASPAPKAVAATPPKLETLPETLAVPTPGATPTAMPTASATPSGEATAPSTSLPLVPVTTPEKASTPLAPLALDWAVGFPSRQCQSLLRKVEHDQDQQEWA